jgi:hypothetical protein
MRKIKIQESEYWFIPDIDDNLAQPDPCRVLIKPLSASEDRRINAESMLRTGSNRTDFDYRFDFGIYLEKVISHCVKKIENYQAVDIETNAIREIRTAEELLKYGEKDIQTLIYKEISDSSRLKSGELKNSNTPQG